MRRIPDTTITNGLLYFEKAADATPHPAGTRPPVGSGWEAVDVVDNVELARPCTLLNPAGAKHIDARRLRLAVWSPTVKRGFDEVAIAYRDEGAAIRVMNDIRQAIEACPSRSDATHTHYFGLDRVELGDDAMRVRHWAKRSDGSFEPTGIRSLAIRRGLAVLFYTDYRTNWPSAPSAADWAEMEQAARTVVPRMCRYTSNLAC